jgi:uncharacterized membrane protein YtjA (UPF0391 family)
MNYLLEGNLDGLGIVIAVILFIGFGIPIILAILGFIYYAKQKRNTAKVLFIIATVYLLISLGICGSMML